MRRLRVVLLPMLCLRCQRPWGATLRAVGRPCPFCGSEWTQVNS
jgi:Zn finger protein HypA/HybF involved in hydrogenase expression